MAAATKPRSGEAAPSASHAHAVTLTEDERERRWANVRPKDAATLLVIDRAGSEPKVLMGRRHERHRFMPGKFVFPGGARDAEDAAMPFVGSLPEGVLERLQARVTRPSASRARALALAAIRETFEETGLALGARVEEPAAAPAGVWSRFAAERVVPDLSGVQFIARAITPPRRPRRFDARFFAAEAGSIAATVPGVTGPDAELTELVWIELSRARTLDLPSITQIVLEELEARIAAGFAATLPVPFFYEAHRRWHRVEL